MPKRGTRLGNFLWPQVMSRFSRHFLWQARQHWNGRTDPRYGLVVVQHCSGGWTWRISPVPPTIKVPPTPRELLQASGIWWLTQGKKNMPCVMQRKKKHRTLQRGPSFPQIFSNMMVTPGFHARHLQWHLLALTSSHSKPLTMKVSHSLHLDGPRSFRSRWVCAALERRMFLNCCWDVPFSVETALKCEKELVCKHGFHLVSQICVWLTIFKSLQGISLFKIIWGGHGAGGWSFQQFPIRVSLRRVKI